MSEADSLCVPWELQGLPSKQECLKIISHDAVWLSPICHSSSHKGQPTGVPMGQEAITTRKPLLGGVHIIKTTTKWLLSGLLVSILRQNIQTNGFSLML